MPPPPLPELALAAYRYRVETRESVLDFEDMTRFPPLLFDTFVCSVLFSGHSVGRPIQEKSRPQIEMFGWLWSGYLTRFLSVSPSTRRGSWLRPASTIRVPFSGVAGAFQALASGFSFSRPSDPSFPPLVLRNAHRLAASASSYVRRNVAGMSAIAPAPMRSPTVSFCFAGLFSLRPALPHACFRQLPSAYQRKAAA